MFAAATASLLKLTLLLFTTRLWTHPTRAAVARPPVSAATPPAPASAQEDAAGGVEAGEAALCLGGDLVALVQHHGDPPPRPGDGDLVHSGVRHIPGQCQLHWTWKYFHLRNNLYKCTPTSAELVLQHGAAVPDVQQHEVLPLPLGPLPRPLPRPLPPPEQQPRPRAR